jgi:hypothetical protein
MKKAAFAAVIAGCIIFALTMASVLKAQVTSKSTVDVTVTDPYGRSVAGLEKANFVITEGGVQRTITAFSPLRDESPKPVAHYKLEFESAGSGAKVEVALNLRSGLPPLTVTWK